MLCTTSHNVQFEPTRLLSDELVLNTLLYSLSNIFTVEMLYLFTDSIIYIQIVLYIYIYI